MTKEQLKEVGEIIKKFFYGNNKDRVELLNKHNIILCEVDEKDNHSYNISISDSLYLITIDGRDYLFDIPWNRFYPYEEMADSVLNWYEF